MDKTRRDEQEAYEYSEDVKRKIHRLGLSKRFYLRASQIKVQRNNGAIVAAKLRNRQLRAALAALREKERNALGANDLVRMQKRVACLKDLHNRLLEEGKTKRKLLAECKTDAEMAEIDAQDVLDQKSPPLCKSKELSSQVHELKSQLRKARDMDSKYQKMLKPMLDERTIFDAKVDTMARNVAKKHQEFDELTFMYHDATRTRELARGKLHQLLKENFPPGVRYHLLFVKSSKSKNNKTILELEEAIANITTKFRTKNMKELYLRLIEEERKRHYMSYYIDELKEMLEKLKDGSTSSKNLHEKVIKLRRKICKPSDTKREEAQTDAKTACKPNGGANNIVTKAHREAGVKNKLFKMVKGLQKLIDKIQEGRLYNSENEQVKRMLLQLEQKLVQILQGVQQWNDEMKAEKAKEHYAKFHRTSIMIRENYEKKLGSSQDDKSPGT